MLFDTRYFWAVFTSRSDETTKGLRGILEKSDTQYVSSISLFEVYRLTLDTEGRTVARLRTDAIEREFKVIEVDSAIVREGAEIGHRLAVPMADALIMATAKTLRVPCVTDDPHFTEVRTLWI